MSVEADMEAVERTGRRGEIGRMLYREARVRVVNPQFPAGGWTGRLAGLLDEPALMLVRDDGVRQMLPQSFAIEEIDGLAPSRPPESDLYPSLVSALDRASGGSCEHCVSEVFSRQIEAVMEVLREFGKVAR